MAKYCGAIGYAVSTETAPGTWVEKITERIYYGEVTKNMNRMRSGEMLNDNMALDNRASVVADPFAYENFTAIRYISYLGSKWKVKSIEVERPRLVMYFGEIYNEENDGESDG